MFMDDQYIKFYVLDLKILIKQILYSRLTIKMVQLMYLLLFHLFFVQFDSSGVNFTNILHAAFTIVDPKSIKNTVKSSVSFYTFWISTRKSCTQNFVEIEPRWSIVRQHDSSHARVDHGAGRHTSVRGSAGRHILEHNCLL